MDAPFSGNDPNGHASMALKFFLELLGAKSGAVLLDLGPVLGDNIAFFCNRVLKVHVCDLFHPLNSAIRQNRSPLEIWRNLNYPAAHFDGICLWDLFDHLQTSQALELVQYLRQWLKPEGVVVIFSRDLLQPQDPFTAFAVQEGFWLNPKPLPELKLPEQRRQNREISALLPSFSSIKSFIYRNGVREHIFRMEAVGKERPSAPSREQNGVVPRGRVKSKWRGL